MFLVKHNHKCTHNACCIFNIITRKNSTLTKLLSKHYTAHTRFANIYIFACQSKPQHLHYLATLTSICKDSIALLWPIIMQNTHS